MFFTVTKGEEDYKIRIIKDSIQSTERHLEKLSTALVLAQSKVSTKGIYQRLKPTRLHFLPRLN